MSPAAGLIVSLSFLIFIPALKPFAFGVWYQSEPVVAALLAAGAAATLCLAFMAATGHRVAGAVTHPLTLVTLAISLWSMIASLATPLPARSLMGPPQTGEGALWYAALAALTALALAVWPIRAIRRAIVGSATVTGLILMGLNISEPIGSPWRPVVWPEFAAVLGLFVIVIVAGDSGIRWPAPLRKRLAGIPMAGPTLLRLTRDSGPLRALVAVGLGGAIVATSQNKTAMGIAVVAIPALLALSPLVRNRRHWRALAMLAALGSTIAVPAGMYWLGTQKGLESPLSRTEMIEVAFRALRSDPMLLAHGTGWGAFNDVLFRYLDEVRDVRAVTETWQQSLENTGGGAFHTHDTYLEALLSTGLPGALLVLALPITAILCARRRSDGLVCAVWVAIAGLMAAWFTLPIAVPFQAVAFAATAGGARRRDGPVPWLATRVAGRSLMTGAALAVALALAAGSALTLRVAFDSERLLAVLREGRGPTPDLPPHLISDGGQGGAHLWWIALDLTHDLAAKGERGQPLTANEVFWFEALMRAVDRHIADLPSSMRLKSLSLIMRDELATKMGDPQLDRLREWEIPAWGQKLHALLDQMPNRVDLSVPFLDLLVNSNNGPVAIRVGNELLARNPDDPVALWFTGVAMAATPEWGNLGQARLLRAADTGIERVLPLSPELRGKLRRMNRTIRHD
ncbi:hypothetical protein N825_27840 [Skermanella stibiiresistens SB22]|uniref:O-antigen ligase-related domain-containing protein n=1 Tax=Skermanella stibiiresistens SB22 TaxID=1385369 RepID=W9H617_9PROT|nr:O-antigen ligase family protein [Skermanella stibiiresistens]EWY41509.1 hypothetical protein N825_27840 [Skermanella stibiiresistens SB22]